jgi:hypothetical protein
MFDPGLVCATEDYGYVDFTVPRPGEFMIRCMPFRASPKPRISSYLPTVRSASVSP